MFVPSSWSFSENIPLLFFSCPADPVPDVVTAYQYVKKTHTHARAYIHTHH